jgi:hypothetical protein
MASQVLNSREFGLPAGTQPQFPRYDFLGKIPFANKKRHYKYPFEKHASHHRRHRRLFFPKTFDDLGKDAPPTQFVSVLERRRGGFGVEGRTMSDQD